MVSFTLAEVLIVLGIIGLIADMTIPTLINGYQKQVTIVKLKNSYTKLSEMLKFSEIDNGPMNQWVVTAETIQGVDYPFFNTYIKPYLRTSNKIAYDLMNIDGQQLSGYDFLMLQDGSSITSLYNLSHGYIWLFLDLNGPKDPNKLGKDIFMFQLLYSKGLKFWLEGTTRNGLINDANGSGYQCKKGTYAMYGGGACGALILNDGWQMLEDYPWN